MKNSILNKQFLFGYQSSIYNEITLHEELEVALKAKDFGLTIFDIFFDTWLPSKISETDKKYILSLRDSKKLEFTVHLPISFGKGFSEVQQEYIDFLLLLEPKTVTIHFNALTFELLQSLLQILPKQTKLSIENTIPNEHAIYHVSYFEFMLQAIKKEKTELKESQPSRIYATLDTGHAKVNGFNPIEYAQKLLDSNIPIATLHLHDNDGKHDQHRAAGSVKKGINFVHFFNVLKTRKEPNKVYCVIEHWSDNAKALKYLVKQI